MGADIEQSVLTEGKSVLDTWRKQWCSPSSTNTGKSTFATDDLRSNVQHARFEQKDPLLIYKFESYELFRKMVQKVNAQVASFLMKCTIPTGASAQQPRQAPRPSAAPRAGTEGRVQNTAERSVPAAAAQGGMPVPAASPQVACLSNVRRVLSPSHPFARTRRLAATRW